MPVDTFPTYSRRRYSPRDSVINVVDSVCCLWPDAQVVTSHAGASSAWIQRISLPFGAPHDDCSVVITLGLDGWEAREMRTNAAEDLGYTQHPVPSANPNDLISVIHDAFAYIHDRTHALGA